jgi:DNA adenine methylase
MQNGDFVYCDPPYVPINSTDEFFSGYGVKFGLKEQTELRDVCLLLKQMGTHGLLSNSDTPIVRELYRDFDIKFIEAPRSISAKSSSRKNVSEVLVSW